VLHDVGTIGVPEAVLNKSGPLGRDEWKLLRQHPQIGLQIVEPLAFGSTATDIILRHHEHWDGTGYPDGLRRDAIPLIARVFAVADAYEAITSERPYRSAIPHEVALEILRIEAGRVHDPDVVDVFIDVVDSAPELVSR